MSASLDKWEGHCEKLMLSQCPSHVFQFNCRAAHRSVNRGQTTISQSRGKQCIRQVNIMFVHLWAWAPVRTLTAKTSGCFSVNSSCSQLVDLLGNDTSCDIIPHGETYSINREAGENCYWREARNLFRFHMATVKRCRYTTHFNTAHHCIRLTGRLEAERQDTSKNEGLRAICVTQDLNRALVLRPLCQRDKAIKDKRFKTVIWGF